MFKERENNGESTTSINSVEDENNPSDKHASGERLFKATGVAIGLEEILKNVILSVNKETWRKRRAG